jgi:6-phosphogluconolactonase
MSEIEIVVARDAEDAVQRAAERLVAAASEGGPVALCGGSTPRPAYRLAAELKQDWTGVDVWLGDERMVPPDDERSNLRLARESLTDRLAGAPRLHGVETSLPRNDAAAAYDAALDGVGLTLALQGLGGDGHTASLFPNAPTLASTARAVAAEPGLEPWVERVTMTVPMLCAAAEVVFLVTGDEKAEAVRRAFAEPPSPSTPASLVRSTSGSTLAILDPAAARLLG